MAAFLTFALALLSVLAAASAAPTAKCNLPWKSPAVNGVTEVYVGTTCTWTWEDDLSHCVIGTAGPVGFNSEDSDGLISGQGSTWSFTFKKAGTFPYKCCQHARNMHGTIKVVSKGPATSCVRKCNGKCYGYGGCPAQLKYKCPYPTKTSKKGTMLRKTKCKTCCKGAGTTCFPKCVKA